MAKTPKTEGLEFLTLSIIAFNGSGYADRESPEAFLDSYIAYSQWKRREKSVSLANTYYYAVLPLCEKLLPAVYESSHKASKKNYNKYLEFRNML